jgi:quercetin dioxygenase-like cupin family protein
MPFIDFKARKRVKIFDGITGTMFHSANITFAHVTLEKDAVVPEHNHIHEQWTHVMDGEMHFNINGEEAVLTSGMTAFIPSNMPHSAKAITLCKVIDCFLPVRQDFIELENADSDFAKQV